MNLFTYMHDILLTFKDFKIQIQNYDFFFDYFYIEEDYRTFEIQDGKLRISQARKF